MPKIATISDRDVALWLAKNRRKRRRGNAAKVTKKASDNDLADEFLRNFTPERLFAALVDGRTPITIEWYVKRMLNILYAEETKSSDRITVLEKLKELLLLGAIQDSSLASAVQSNLSGKRSAPDISDPFVGGSLKFKKGKTG
jgi:hypothetical protein